MIGIQLNIQKTNKMTDWKEESKKLDERISKLLNESPFSKAIIIDRIKQRNII